MSPTEFDIIERYFRPLQRSRPELRLGIGDDAAVLACPPGQELVLTMDTLINGVHFPDDAPARSVGHKALAANLSDLAAMGADPAAALLALSLPRFDGDWLEAFCAGFAALAGIHGVSLIGGDTTRGPLTVSVQATGTIDAGQAIRRDGARAGDIVLVSGTLGDAALGLAAWQSGDADGRESLVERLHYPTPRVALGRLLVGRAHACIDISDGLLADLGHILAASGVGARLEADRVPVSAAFEAACPVARRHEFALSWGDDYELCACVAPTDVDDLVAAARAMGECLTPVGRVVDSGELEVLDGAGRHLDAGRPGYRHFGTDSGETP